MSVCDDNARLFLCALGACLLGAGAARAQVHTGDIVLAVQQGVMKTGSGAPSAGAFTPDRVFGVVLGAQGPAHFASNPGFDSEAGAFPTPSEIGFNILDRLWFWNGETLVPTGGEAMQVSAGATTRLTGAGFVAGFTLSVGANGQWHRHLSYLLLPGAAPAIDPGVYVLSLELFSTSGAVANTPSFHLVFRDGATAQQHAAAIAFVRARVLPPAVSGDANADGRVDFLDLNIVLGEFGSTTAWLAGDVNRDGFVDFLDLNIVLGSFGT